MCQFADGKELHHTLLHIFQTVMTFLPRPWPARSCGGSCGKRRASAGRARRPPRPAGRSGPSGVRSVRSAPSSNTISAVFPMKWKGTAGFLLIPAFAMLAFLPFSVFLYQAYRKAFRMARQNDFILWSIIVSLVILIFFSFSATKLLDYPMPAYPFVALILGYYLSDSLMKEMTSMLWLIILIGVAIPWPDILPSVKIKIW